ncbi:unnamed protein product [Cunninghamella blakesleeana]
MAFIFESLRRRPFEQKSLAITRAISSMLMILTFFAFFAYLIYQLLTDQFTLASSFVDIPENGYPAPDIEICYSGNWTFTHCNFQEMDWTIKEFPGCEGHYRDGNYNGGEMCRVFQANFTNFGIASKGRNDPTIRRVDIYWKLDNATAAAALYSTIPSIPISLYDQSFSTWRLNEDEINAMIPIQKGLFNKSMLTAERPMTMLNHSSAIFFTPRVYKIIDLSSSSSLIGLYNNYIDIITMQTSQHDWPLQPNANLTRGDYHGFFSVQLAVTTMEILTAKRQNTVLSTLALLGGAWGGMTTLYAVVFGTPRLTPFGLVHQIPLMLSKKEPDNDQSQKSIGTSTSTKKMSLFKRFNHQPSSTKALYNNYNNKSSSTYDNDDIDDDEENNIIKSKTSEQLEYNDPPSLNLNTKFKKIDERFNEMELILKEFVLNMDYYYDPKIKHLRDKLFQNDATPSSHDNDNLEENINENVTILMKNYK